MEFDGSVDEQRFRMFYANHRFLKLVCRKCKKYLEPYIIGHDVDRVYYCPGHCPEHVWDTEEDSGVYCQHCGINFEFYLQLLLRNNGIDYDKKWAYGSATLDDDFEEDMKNYMGDEGDG